LRLVSLPLSHTPDQQLTRAGAPAYSGVMDIFLALLPWPIIWKLQMKRKEKIGVALAMSMGVL
jgi:hypothetical protein